MHVLVIGGGVIGASTAYRLARGGAAVTLLDRGRIGGGTSATSFAWTNSNQKTPRAYHELNVEGMRAHAALRAEFGSC
ncbi:MAG TPA: FAD-dependent oxidoreductase, partial [bacterium]|nr:FAD-dependent oxidoreductase [bacterium]